MNNLITLWIEKKKGKKVRKNEILTLKPLEIGKSSNSFAAITDHLFLQFMRPRSRDKKLIEEWAVPLKSIEDIYEVGLIVIGLAIYFILTKLQDQLSICWSLLHIRDSDCFAWESWEAILGQNLMVFSQRQRS